MRKVVAPEGPSGAEGDSVAADVVRLRELLTALGRRRSLRDPIGEMVEPCPLPPAQAHSLLWLGSDGALTMGELAKLGGVTEKTMTGVVDRLEEAALVRRDRDDQDRRVVRVKLTARGAALYRDIDARITAKMRWLLGLLDARDRRGLCGIFARLERRLAALADRAPVKDAP